MDSSQIVDSVSKLGFPIVAALGLAYALYRVGRYAAEKADYLLGHVAGQVADTKSAVDTIKPQLDRIEQTQKAHMEVCRTPTPAPARAG